MSIFGGLFGKSQQRDMTSAYNDSQGRLDAARGTARADITGGRDRALGQLSPYMQGGQRGQTAYENTLGLNGQDARNRQFQEGYVNDPAGAYRAQQGQTAMANLLRKYNASPSGVNSGAAMYGAGRLTMDRFDRDWGDYQNRLMQLGQQGQQMAGQAAQMEYGAGNQLANLEMGYGNTSAANRINYGNAMAQSRNVGLNNLLAIAGTAAKFFPGGGMGGQQQAANVSMGQPWTNPDNGRVWGGY